MQTIAVTCPRGGSGRTTVTAALAWSAAERGIPTLAAALDRSGHLVHLLYPEDPVLTLDEAWKVSDTLDVTYSPLGPPVIEALELKTPPALVLLDLGYSVEPVTVAGVDLWVAPVNDRTAILNLESVLPLPPSRHGTCIVLNQNVWPEPYAQYVDKLIEATERQLPTGLLKRCTHHIPDSWAIRRAIERQECPWKRFPRAYGAVALKRWADVVLNRLQLTLEVEE